MRLEKSLEGLTGVTNFRGKLVLYQQHISNIKQHRQFLGKSSIRILMDQPIRHQ